MLAYAGSSKNLKDLKAGRVLFTLQCKYNYFTDTCSASKAGSYLRLIDFHVTPL